MRFINHSFDWTDTTKFAWNEEDVKLLQVIDDVNDIFRIAEAHVTVHDAVIQAGGACGIWPLALSKIFDRVQTIEPLTKNFDALAWNIENTRNIHATHGVLGNGLEPNDMLCMQQHPTEKQNAGSEQVQFIKKTSDIKLLKDVHSVTRIDDYAEQYDKVGMICLDLEGYELMALQGADKILRRDHPVLMVEDKGLSEKFQLKKGAVIKWLENEYGYRVAERIKRDVILV